MTKNIINQEYSKFLADLKERVASSRYKAALSVNKELIHAQSVENPMVFMSDMKGSFLRVRKYINGIYPHYQSCTTKSHSLFMCPPPSKCTCWVAYSLSGCSSLLELTLFWILIVSLSLSLRILFFIGLVGLSACF